MYVLFKVYYAHNFNKPRINILILVLSDIVALLFSYKNVLVHMKI